MTRQQGALPEVADSAVVPQPRRAWLMAFMIFALAMINFGDKTVLGLAADPISDELGLSHSLYGLVASSFFVLFSISAVVVGFVANRVATRWVLLALAVVWSLAQLPLLLAASVGTLFASRVVLGAGEGPTAGVAVHALYKWFPPRRRALPSALYVIGSGLGVFVAAPVLTHLIDHHGWRAAFWALAATGALWAVLWLLIGREGPFGVDADGNAQSASPSGAEPSRASASLTSYRRFLGSRTWWGGAIGGFGAYWTVALGSAFLPSYLKDQYGYTSAQAAQAVALYAAFTVVVPLTVSPWAARMSRRGVSSRRSRGITQGALVLAAGTALAFLPSVEAKAGQLALVAVAFGFGVGAFGLSYETTSEVTPVDRRGASLGLLVAVQTLPGLIAPAVTGVLIDAASDDRSGYTLAFVFGGALTFVCGLVAVLTVDPERDAPKAPVPTDVEPLPA
ncbi:MFS transporter [Streptomyces sp. NPDC058193]|uniref:MFS transporter n=1 Tax=Streptomyces sp. NPDC058193 TaxID=3346373 RepID=UPI0036EA6869